jgi:hypothetical protein
MWVFVDFGGFLWVSHVGSAGFEFRCVCLVFSFHSGKFYVWGYQRLWLRSAKEPVEKLA